jgi:hypothetical protein
LALNIVNFFATFITIFSIERCEWIKSYIRIDTSNYLTFGHTHHSWPCLAIVYWRNCHVFGAHSYRCSFIFSGRYPSNGYVLTIFLLSSSSCYTLLMTFYRTGIGVTFCCALYVIGFAYSWGPVVWVVCAEMFPMRERGKANSLTTFSNWFWTCIVGAVFPIASTASLAGCFGFFAAVVFIATTVSAPKLSNSLSI